ncbi:hypothetical protein NDN08_003626 [Rhodosorus marinus]|uniref:DUS-like FMN-binding domain-containing protein n=1 Tax=Rhodosorus marinus TaxID=101924 RepID=A0AAV8UX42_9RHOD|nr:hypothetical protein NDN08_003626 [Rhodosorus marinus]
MESSSSRIVGCYGFVSVYRGTLTRRGRTMVMNRRMEGEFADKFSVAPMMDVTDLHFNTFARSISKHATLWSEMLVDSTAIYNPERTERFFKLGEDLRVGPTVLQLGGSDPNKLAQAASYVQDFGYDEINLNCGCPSDRVSGKGCFGAALMKTPDLVADITARMSAAVRGTVPISVKCRIGVDDLDSYESLRHFIMTVSSKGDVKRFVIHARKAILKGLSPAQNRSIPPLKYDYVYRLIEEFPDLYFTINGGVQDLNQVEEHLARGAHGVMLGRAARDRIWDALGGVDARVYGDLDKGRSRREIILEYAEYADNEFKNAKRVSKVVLVKPFISAFHGEDNGRLFRQAISNNIRTMSIYESVSHAFKRLDDEVLDRLPGQPKPERVLSQPTGIAELETVADIS